MMADGGVEHMSKSKPRCILIFSGKRKSGKDYIVEMLLQRLKASDAVVVRLSAPIKKHWAESQGLDFDELLAASAYKENHRLEMICWGESVRANDPGFFCRHAIDLCGALNFSAWIISDARRKSDLEWFLENYSGQCTIRTIRVVCSDEIRKKRGWIFTSGVDDAESECNLDSVSNWNWTIPNNGDNTEVLETVLQDIAQFVNSLISTK